MHNICIFNYIKQINYTIKYINFVDLPNALKENFSNHDLLDF